MSKMTKSLVAASVLAATTLASGTAMADFSGNVGVTSDYIWRGETQASDESAVSGGLDYSHESGIYVGTWASSLGGSSEYELDIYGGFAFDVGPVSLDIGAINYGYPKDGNTSDTTEGYIGVSYGMFSAKYSATDDYFDSGDSASYLEAAIDYPIKDDLTLGLHVGNKFGDYFDNKTSNDGSYSDYSISLSKGDFTFAYSNTDNDKANGQTDNARIAVSWSHSVDF